MRRNLFLNFEVTKTALTFVGAAVYFNDLQHCK